MRQTMQSGIPGSALSYALSVNPVLEPGTLALLGGGLLGLFFMKRRRNA